MTDYEKGTNLVSFNLWLRTKDIDII